MRCRWVQLFLLLALALTVGCNKESSNLSGGESSTKETETMKVPEPFVFDGEKITKVTISRGDGQLAVELKDSKNLNKLKVILDNADSFSGAYPFDLLSVIVLEYKDGTKRELRVTGNGYVFVDETAKIAYHLDKQKFFNFVKEVE